MKDLLLLASKVRKVVSYSSQELEKLANEIENSKLVDLKEKYGKPLGKGSSRIVFKIGNGLVAKRAMNDLGLNQNDQEYDIHRFEESEFVTKVYAISDNSKVIISEEVTPLRKSKFSKAEKDKLGMKTIKGRPKNSRHSYEMEMLVGEDWDFLGNFDTEGLVYIDNPREVGHSIGFSGDFVRPSSWGKRKDGSLVLLDVGY